MRQPSHEGEEIMMKIFYLVFVCFLVQGWFFPEDSSHAWAEDEKSSPKEVKTDTNPSSLTASSLLEKIEKRYTGSGFTAAFDQESTLAAMDITDYAGGVVTIKRPGMMRWEYKTPEKQVIVTDSVTLWIYRPTDNQVLIGNASEYFGKGKGAGFLSDIGVIRDQFTHKLVPSAEPDTYVLRIVPKDPGYEIVRIDLVISSNTFDILEIETENLYKDITRIRFSGIRRLDDVDPSIFTFKVPQDADLFYLEEKPVMP